MTRIDLDDTPYYGTTRSYSYLTGPRDYAACRSCGSSLAGRLERCEAGMDVYRCRCGTGRHVRYQGSGAAQG